LQIFRGFPINSSIFKANSQKIGASNSATSVLTKPKTQKLEVSSLKTSKKPYPVQATAIQHETLEQAGSYFKAGFSV
jgi:hypothetical protein